MNTGFIRLSLVISRRPYIIQTNLIFFKLSVDRPIMRTLFFIVFIFCFSAAHSQVNPSSNSMIQMSGTVSIEETLLKQAELITPQVLQDLENRKHLANEALQLSLKKENNNISAQAHTLLGEIALKQNDIEQSIKHFLAASIIYRDNKDKRYEQTAKIIDELLPIAQQNGKSLSIANLLIKQGDTDYNLKHYNDANEQYLHAIKYLDNPDKKAQKMMGEAYKKLAQSYKRLENREKTAFFYKKALDTFTAINDKKIWPVH